MSSSPSPPPPVLGPSVTVADYASLVDALASQGVSTITITADITGWSDELAIERDLTILGDCGNSPCALVSDNVGIDGACLTANQKYHRALRVDRGDSTSGVDEGSTVAFSFLEFRCFHLDWSDSFGGAVTIWSSFATFYSCMFSYNSAGKGGAVGLAEGGATSFSLTTFIGNTATTATGGAALAIDADVTVVNLGGNTFDGGEVGADDIKGAWPDVQPGMPPSALPSPPPPFPSPPIASSSPSPPPPGDGGGGDNGGMIAGVVIASLLSATGLAVIAVAWKRRREREHLSQPSLLIGETDIETCGNFVVNPMLQSSTELIAAAPTNARHQGMSVAMYDL